MSGDFAGELAGRAQTVATMARSLLRKAPGLYAGRDYDDVVSLLHETMWAIWREAGGSFPDGWERQLWLRGRTAVQRWADASAGTGGLSGASEQRRLLRSAMSAEPEWQRAHPGQVATPEQLGEWWAGVGGSKFTSVARTVPLGEASDPPAGGVPTEDEATAWVAIERAVAVLTEAAGQHNERLGRFAKAWLGGLVTGDARNVTELAQACGLARASATRYVAAVRRAALQLLPDLIGGGC